MYHFARVLVDFYTPWGRYDTSEAGMIPMGGFEKNTTGPYFPTIRPCSQIKKDNRNSSQSNSICRTENAHEKKTHFNTHIFTRAEPGPTSPDETWRDTDLPWPWPPLTSGPQSRDRPHTWRKLSRIKVGFRGIIIINYTFECLRK